MNTVNNSLTRLCKIWMNRVDEKVREMNLLRFKLNKPDMSGFIAVNLKTGKTRKPKVGEFNPLVIDYSDPSPMDGDLVMPERKGVIKHVKKK